MAKIVDPELLKVATKYSAPPREHTKEIMPELRQASRAARSELVGRHADAVAITESPAMRRFTPVENMIDDTVILYIHGGCWISCDTVTHGAIMSDLAYLTGYEVIGPDYPLAPENPYPAGLDMIMDLIHEWRRDNPHKKLIVGGDSAGANLALAVALRLRDEGLPDAVSSLLLWYGCFRKKFDTPSHQQYGGGEFGLRTDVMVTGWDWYLGDHSNPIYGDLSNADVTGLPPCYIAEAELDCLADDSRWLADKLTAASIAHTDRFHPGVNHGFIHFGQHYPPSYYALVDAAHFVKGEATV